jgi:hypothetical protein
MTKQNRTENLHESNRRYKLSPIGFAIWWFLAAAIQLNFLFCARAARRS